MSRKLEIGSGNRPLPGYEHLDINPDCPCVEHVCPMDKIPIEDNIFEEIQAIHVIEHQSWQDTLVTLKEWVRVLKPEGMLRIATPNLNWVSKTYLLALAGSREEMERDAGVMTDEERCNISLDGQIDPGLWANFKIMSSSREWDQHFACFDASLLTNLLKKAGCSKVETEHNGDSLVLRAFK